MYRDFLPEKRLFHILRNDLSFHMDKAKFLAILTAIMRWSFNPKAITPSGASFIQTSLGIDKESLHRFFTYNLIDPKTHYEIQGGEILTYKDSVFNTDPRFLEEDWLEILKIIKALNIHKLYPNAINKGDIKTVLTVFYKWLREPSEYRDSLIRKNIDFSDAIFALDDESFLRSRIQGKVFFENIYELNSAGVLDIRAKVEGLYCENCNNAFPCVEKYGEQYLCRKCIASLGVGDFHDCSHLECTFYECENAELYKEEIYGFDF